MLHGSSRPAQAELSWVQDLSSPVSLITVNITAAAGALPGHWWLLGRAGRRWAQPAWACGSAGRKGHFLGISTPAKLWCCCGLGRAGKVHIRTQWGQPCFSPPSQCCPLLCCHSASANLQIFLFAPQQSEALTEPGTNLRSWVKFLLPQRSFPSQQVKEEKDVSCLWSWDAVIARAAAPSSLQFCLPCDLPLCATLWCANTALLHRAPLAAALPQELAAQREREQEQDQQELASRAEAALLSAASSAVSQIPHGPVQEGDKVSPLVSLG